MVLKLSHFPLNLCKDEITASAVIWMIKMKACLMKEYFLTFTKSLLFIE